MTRLTYVLVVMGVAAAAGVGRADDRPKADPPTTPLALNISGTTTYTLNTGGLCGADYRTKILNAVEAVRPPLAPPAVDLVVEVWNTSDSSVRIWTRGDPVVLELTLRGNGAVNVMPQLFYTAEYRMPQAIDLPPGAAYPIPVRELVSGFRGVSRCSYWTEPGEYRLVATLWTGVQPAPLGAVEVDDGFGLVTLISAPLRINVERMPSSTRPRAPWWPFPIR
jgi:hypothetical protein